MKDESLDKAIFRKAKLDQSAEEEAEREIKEAMEALKDKRVGGLLPWETSPEVM